jgi:DNA-binding NtrC family response regulator
MTNQPRILVIDDEPDMLENCRLILSREGFEILTSTETADIGRIVSDADPDMILTDLMIPGKDGLEVLRDVKWSHTDVPVVIMTAYATVETAVAAMKDGAADYIVKPFSKDQLLLLVRRVLKSRELQLENQRLRRELEQQKLSATLTTLSPGMLEVASIISRIADTGANVLIQGESGSGKEVIARAIHNSSRRSAGPFVAVNCSALPAPLLESELFGHEKGAFTGAATSRKGLMEEAQAGTFFLDEITEMDSGMQAKLLRVLQERRVRRVGGNREIELDIRLIAATNRDPQAAVSEKLLREDLFFRLAVVTISVPPLRKRKEDIPALANRFLHETGIAYGRDVQGFTPQVLELLTNYSWPGNVRELRNVVERAVSLATRPVIREEDLPEPLRRVRSRQIAVETTAAYEDAKAQAVDHFQREYFTALLAEENNNITRVAARAKVDRKTVYRILKAYGFDQKPGEDAD